MTDKRDKRTIYLALIEGPGSGRFVRDADGRIAIWNNVQALHAAAVLHETGGNACQELAFEVDEKKYAIVRGEGDVEMQLLGVRAWSRLVFSRLARPVSYAMFGVLIATVCMPTYAFVVALAALAMQVGLVRYWASPDAARARINRTLGVRCVCPTCVGVGKATPTRPS